MDLKDKVVVITGGGRGIGKSIAEILAKDGAKVIICSRSKKDLIRVCKGIEKFNGKCEYYGVDVTKSSQVNKLIDKVVSVYGKIDVLINNAGWSNTKNYIENITDEEYKICLNTNVDSVFYFLRKILPIMKVQNYGTIINISSGAGKSANPILPVYSASKFAVQAFTEAVAKELKELNYNVNCIAVCPSGVNTGMRARLFGQKDAELQQSPDAVASVIRDILVGKVVVPNGGDIHIRNGKIVVIIDVLGNFMGLK